MDSFSEAVNCLCADVTLFQLVPLTYSSNKEYWYWGIFFGSEKIHVIDDSHKSFDMIYIFGLPLKGET